MEKLIHVITDSLLNIQECLMLGEPSIKEDFDGKLIITYNMPFDVVNEFYKYILNRTSLMIRVRELDWHIEDIEKLENGIVLEFQKGLYNTCI